MDVPQLAVYETVMTIGPITRRDALRIALTGSVAVASTAIALSGPLATTILAGPNAVVGVRLGAVPTASDQPEVDRTELDGSATPAPLARVGLSAQSLDLATGQVRPVGPVGVRPGDPPLLAANEVIGGATAFADGSIALAISPPGYDRRGATPRLALVGRTRPVVIPLAGLADDEQLRDLAQTSGGRLLGLVMRANDAAPTSLATVDATTGLIGSSRVRLASTRRFRGLTTAADGSLYSATVEVDGTTRLVQIDPQQGTVADIASLSLADGTSWNDGIASLMYLGGTRPQFLALAAPRYDTTRKLYRLDPASGVMTMVSTFDAVKAFLMV
jgi:hypothetical protein